MWPMLIGAGAGLLGHFLGGNKPQQVNTGVDPASQGYIDRMRNFGMGGANTALNQPDSFFAGPLSNDAISGAMSPYIQNVVSGVQGQYDLARESAAKNNAQQATMQGAYGGSRAAVTEGARLGALDRSQAGDIAGILQGGYGQALQLAEARRQQQEQQLQEPLWRQQQALGMMNFGMGPVGQQTTRPNQSNWFSSMLGGALSGASLFG